VPFRERLIVAVVSLLSTWLFFFEYIPPNKRVRLWSDIEGYHYPLLNYAHKSIMDRRFPLWDPAIYCGIPFAGNIQAGLFYPPNWLLFAANANLPPYLQAPGQHGMRFTSIEILAFLHLWLAFLFTYFWLREPSTNILPPIIGGMTVACGGYLLSQMNHLGVACGYAWFPLALWGIEQANARRTWRPLWKVSIASALCLLAGYPPTWVAFCVVVGMYALALHWRKRLFAFVVAAVVFSGVLSAVQLLPAYEASAFKTPEETYGSEPPFGSRIYAALLLPNYFNQNRTRNEGVELSEVDYLYLGVPALFGIMWLVRRGWFPGAGPALAIAGMTLYLVVDPGDLVLRAIPHVPLARELIRRHNLMAGLPIASALLAASALTDFLARRANTLPAWLNWIFAAVALLWMAALSTVLQPFATGSASIWYPAAGVAIFACGMWIYRSRRSSALAAILALLTFVEYRAFGINRRFNATTENADQRWRGDARLGGKSLGGLEDAVYAELLRNPGYRIALYEAPHSTDMRHYGLATPQGFDPLVSNRYKAAVETFVPFKTNRLFDIDPLNEPMLKEFGVRWVMVRQDGDIAGTLTKHARFRRIPGNSYFAVFEYLEAQPAWRYNGAVQMKEWRAERRAFRVRSDSGGLFTLVEQFYPGWQAFVDRKPAPVSLAAKAFQSVNVPQGEHDVEFRYSPASLKIGAIVTAAGLTALIAAIVFGPARQHLSKRTWPKMS
jgi:hypothetical protein